MALEPPGPGEARVAIRAASLNFPDWLVIQGKYQWQPEPPFTPGVEFAGEVVALGPGCDPLSVGDRVLTVGTTGGFATHANVSAKRLKAVPTGMSWEEAAVLLVAYGTAHHALIDRGSLRAGETVLVLGAAGGTGTAAIQVARAAHARVIAAAGDARKCELCRRLGAEATIDYSQEDVREALRALVPAGPDVIFDAIGGPLSEPCFRSIAWRGRYLVVGFASGEIPRLPLNLPLLKGAAIIGVFWGAFDAREGAHSNQLLDALGAGHRAGWLRPVIDRISPMEELPMLMQQMASRQLLGKVVLVNESGS